MDYDEDLDLCTKCFESKYARIVVKFTQAVLILYEDIIVLMNIYLFCDVSPQFGVNPLLLLNHQDKKGINFFFSLQAVMGRGHQDFLKITCSSV